MDFSADQLQVFATVVEEGSVTGAARALNVTQPAVSSRLRNLQLLAGRRLYRRSARGIELTEAGTALLPHARAVARALARARQAVEAPAAAELRTTIAISEAAIPLVMPRIVSVALERPVLEVRVVPCDATTAVQTVFAGAADLAVSVAPPDPPSDDLSRRPVLVDEIVLIRARGRERRAPMGLVEGLTVLWQARGSAVRATVERALEAEGVWPRTSLEVGSSLGVLAAVAAGEGAGFLPRSYVAQYADAGLVWATSLVPVALEARFELISAAVEDLPVASRRLADGLKWVGPLGAAPAHTAAAGPDGDARGLARRRRSRQGSSGKLRRFT
jgi:DNA-binding transcriptional LysR family regulator